MRKIKKIDTHQHFWKYNPDEFGWIPDDQLKLQRNFMPDDLIRELKKSGFESSIAVQARQSLAETRWLLCLAETYRAVVGVVGWVDLRSTKLEEQLTEFTQSKYFKGVRHVVQDEPDDQFVLQPDFLNGISLLRSYRLVYEILIFSRQLPASIKMVDRFPRQRFVLDHIGKPDIKNREYDKWAAGIAEIASYPNVSVKLSGMVTEADLQNWTPADFYPYLEHVWDCFGEERIMVGSDWPVCLMAANYAQVACLIEGFLEQFSQTTLQKVYAGNARRIYRL